MLRREVVIPERAWGARAAALLIGAAIGCLAVGGASCGRGKGSATCPRATGGDRGDASRTCEVRP